MRPRLRKLPLWWMATNASASLLGRAGLLSFDLSEDEFLGPTRTNCGPECSLDGSTADGLRAFVEAFRRHGELTYVGLRGLRSSLSGAIRQRACYEQQFDDHPAILEVPIVRPVFIVGFPRSGTTLLQQLLALHPGCRWLRPWELEVPFPAERQRWGTSGDHRRVGYESWLKRAAKHPSGLNHLHSDDSPGECWSLLWASFLAHEIFSVFGFNGYMQWWRGLSGDARDNAYRFYRKQLQYLRWVEPGSHWVLKSPSHMVNLDALVKAFPDARIIQLHRNPREAVPSYSSLAAYLQYGMTRDWDPRAIGPQVFELLGEWARTNLAQRRELGPDRVLDVSYEQLVDSPMAVVRAIYDRFEMQYPATMEDRMTDWLARRHGRNRPVHRYGLEDFGLESADLADRFAEYCACYSVPSNVARLVKAGTTG